jgi:aspartate 1-decarboxylase
VWDVTNGSRLITYALAGPRGSRVMCVNGAGAHIIKTGDIIIIATFAEVEDVEAKFHQPRVVFLEDNNVKGTME